MTAPSDPPSGPSFTPPPPQPPPPPTGPREGGGGASSLGRGRGGGWLRFGVVGAGVVALVVVAFFIMRAVQGGSGPQSPEEAVQELADAVDAEDPLAAITVMNPDEVRTLGDLYKDTEAKAKEFGLAGQDDTFRGVDLSVDDLELEVEELSSDVAKVTIEDGRLDYEIDGSELTPRVQAARSNAAFEEGEPSEGDEDISGSITESDFEDEEIDEPFLMVVERSGSWYVSPALTAAEYLVQSADLPDGDYDAVEASDEVSDADSPSDAARNLASAVGDLDPSEMAAALPEYEGAALRVYEDAIEEALNEEADVSDIEIDVDDLELSEEELNDTYTKVVIEAGEGSISYVDEDGEPQETTYRWDGQCLTYTDSDDDEEQACIEDDAERFGVTEAFVLTTEEDGRWVVSPVATLLQYGQEILPTIDENVVLRILDIPSQAEPVDELPLGEQVEPEYNDAGFATYVAELEPGTYFVDNAAFEGGLQVADPDGQVLNRFPTFTVTDPGEYRIAAVGEEFSAQSSEGSFGVYQLEEETIPAGVPTSLTLEDDEPAKLFVVDSEPGLELSVSFTEAGEEFSTDADVVVLDEEGQEVDCFDEVCETDSAGELWVLVTRSSDASSPVVGELTVAEPPPVTFDGEPPPVTENLDESDLALYDVTVAAPVTLTVAPAPGLDLALDVEGESVNVGPAGAPEVIELEPGTYFFDVVSVSGAGSFTITASP